MTDTVRAEMVKAMKEKDKDRKDALSAMLTVLKNGEIEKREPLTEDEAVAILKKELKQLKETFDSAPDSRQDIKEAARTRMEVIKQFVPEDMNEEQIAEVIKSVLSELSIDAPTGKDKGNIMKTLMPRLKGKADGKLVNEVLQGFLK